ncbi:hypothetical protein KC887_07045 [Candidatus Kaiserbacteria bacterium]|nr:hypothetical protein [Candidatus Kaiserbacteria bacterium]
MPQITRKQIDDLRQAMKRIQEMLDAIDGVPVVVDAEVAERVAAMVANRICLACGQKADAGEKMRRGQDPACYATTRRAKR